MTTNRDDLILVCDRCGHTQPAGPEWPPARWPAHCDHYMRIANLTDRDGNPIDRDNT